jgi:hypothetical protein
VTLTAAEGTVLEAVRRILNAECQHPRLACGATRALDWQKFWIGLSHGKLAEDETITRENYVPRAVAVCPTPDRSFHEIFATVRNF